MSNMSTNYFTAGITTTSTAATYGAGADAGGMVDPEKAQAQIDYYQNLADSSTGALRTAYLDVVKALQNVKEKGLEAGREELFQAFWSVSENSPGYNAAKPQNSTDAAFSYRALACAIRTGKMDDTKTVIGTFAQSYSDLSANWANYTNLVNTLKNIDPNDVDAGKAIVRAALEKINTMLGDIQKQKLANPGDAGRYTTQVKLLSSLFIDLSFRKGVVDGVRPEAVPDQLAAIKDIACNAQYGVLAYTMDARGNPMPSLPFAGYDSFPGPKDSQGRIPLMFVGRDENGLACNSQFMLQFASGPGGLFLKEAKDGSGNSYYQLVDGSGGPVSVGLSDGSVVDRLTQTCWPINIGDGNSPWDYFSNMDAINARANTEVMNVINLLEGAA